MTAPSQKALSPAVPAVYRRHRDSHVMRTRTQYPWVSEWIGAFDQVKWYWFRERSDGFFGLNENPSVSKIFETWENKPES